MSDGSDQAVVSEFEEAMCNIYDVARRDVGYTATRFIQMVAEHGGLETARRLLAGSQVSEGFTTLVMAGRRDLTVEHLVLEERFRGLFTRLELREATRRLACRTVAPGGELAARSIDRSRHTA